MAYVAVYVEPWKHAIWRYLAWRLAAYTYDRGKL